MQTKFQVVAWGLGNNQEEKRMLFVLSFIVDVVSILLSGIALKFLWKWFIVATFSLPALSMPQAIGLSIVMAILTAQHIPRNEEEIIELYLWQLTYPIVALGIGFVVSLFL
jgi:hypothetical protein